MRRSRACTQYLLGLLKDGDPEQMCAAAVLLAKVPPKNPQLVLELALASRAAPVPVRPYVLAALASCKPAWAAPHLIPCLDESGVTREQVIRLLIAFGDALLPQLDAATPCPERSVATARILVGIGSNASLSRLMTMLRDAEFPLARAIVAEARRALPHRDEAFRCCLGKHAARLLRSLPPLSAPTSQIALLKLLGAVGDASVIPAILKRLRPDLSPAVRFSALEALAHVPISDRMRGSVVRAVTPSLSESARCPAPALSLQVLRRLDPLPFRLSTLKRLLDASYPATVRLAIRELPRFADDEVLAILQRLMSHPRVPIQKAAAQALAQCPGALKVILEKSDEPEWNQHRSTIAEALATEDRSLGGDEIQSHVLPLLDKDADPDKTRSRLLLLASFEKNTVGRLICDHAKALLRSGHAERVILLLEPLVRHRLATTDARYLLLLAHIKNFHASADGKAATRAEQLALPLLRSREVHLLQRLDVEVLLTTEEREALLSILEPPSRRASKDAPTGTSFLKP